MACVTRGLQMMGAGSLGRTGWEGDEGELPFVREQWDLLELCLGLNDEPTESLWVRISRQSDVGDTAVRLLQIA